MGMGLGSKVAIARSARRYLDREKSVRCTRAASDGWATHAGVTSFDPWTGTMRKVDIDITFTAKSWPAGGTALRARPLGARHRLGCATKKSQITSVASIASLGASPRRDPLFPPGQACPPSFTA